MICPLNQTARMLGFDNPGIDEPAAMERTMKLQDVILKAMAKKISWMEAAEIAGVTDRTMRRIRDRYEEFGYTGLFESEAGQEEHAPDPDGDG